MGESTPQYLYSSFNCDYPLKTGDNCNLTLSIGGYHDNKKHKGVLYFADDNSKTRVIHAYIRYHLVSKDNSGTITAGDPFTLMVTNVGGSNYEHINVSGLPEMHSRHLKTQVVVWRKA